MDFRKSTVLHMDIHDFWMSVFNYPCKCGNPHSYPRRDIHAWTFYNGCPWNVNNHKWIAMFYVSLQLSMQVWISTFISKKRYPCMDILQWMSVEREYPQTDIHVSWLSVFHYLCLGLISTWISINFYGYPCMDLLWTLDPR